MLDVVDWWDMKGGSVIRFSLRETETEGAYLVGKNLDTFAVEGLGYIQTPPSYCFSLIKVFLTLSTRRSSYIFFPCLGQNQNCSSHSCPRSFASFSMGPPKQLINRVSDM
jgi:hypothetical protein